MVDYNDSFLEEVEQKGYVSGYQDGVVEACDLFVEKCIKFHDSKGILSDKDIEDIKNFTINELHAYILED